HNTDGTYSSNGQLKEVVKAYMIHGKHKETVGLAIMKLHGTDLILGYDWLRRHNPHFNWIKGEMDYSHCKD
ncbi:hypothetical protein WOLCODRAFT_74706, partial [Wolfiporia cocos MD-104 SS10]